MGHLVPVPLGMTSGEVPDQNITASSTFDLYRFPNQARLHNEKKGRKSFKQSKHLALHARYFTVNSRR